MGGQHSQERHMGEDGKYVENSDGEQGEGKSQEEAESFKSFPGEVEGKQSQKQNGKGRLKENASEEMLKALKDEDSHVSHTSGGDSWIDNVEDGVMDADEMKTSSGKMHVEENVSMKKEKGVFSQMEVKGNSRDEVKNSNRMEGDGELDVKEHNKEHKDLSMKKIGEMRSSFFNSLPDEDEPQDDPATSQNSGDEVKNSNRMEDGELDVEEHNNLSMKKIGEMRTSFFNSLPDEDEPQDDPATSQDEDKHLHGKDGQHINQDKDGKLQGNDRQLMSQDKEGRLKGKDGQLMSKSKDEHLMSQDKDGRLQGGNRQLMSQDKEGRLQGNDGQLMSKSNDGQLMSQFKDGGLQGDNRQLMSQDKEGRLQGNDGQLMRKGKTSTEENDAEEGAERSVAIRGSTVHTQLKEDQSWIQNSDEHLQGQDKSPKYGCQDPDVPGAGHREHPSSPVNSTEEVVMAKKQSNVSSAAPDTDDRPKSRENSVTRASFHRPQEHNAEHAGDREEQQVTEHISMTKSEENFSQKEEQVRKEIPSDERNCSRCGESLKGKTKFLLDCYNLYYHADCFRCTKCDAPFGDSGEGTSMFVIDQRVHCNPCYKKVQGM
uniref:protein qua-1-like n=1 Tax=Myxine glutinosa TaxID=7769 RepID=UPI00358DF157